MKLKLNYNNMFFVFTLFSLFFLLVSKSELKNLDSGEEEYLLFAEKMPAPVGGLEAIMKKISYPEMAQKSGIQGKVYVLIYVNENGNADDVKVVRGLGMGCDEEAIKAIKSTKFTPATNNGVAVKIKLTLAITFKLS